MAGQRSGVNDAINAIVQRIAVTGSKFPGRADHKVMWPSLLTAHVDHGYSNSYGWVTDEYARPVGPTVFIYWD